MRKFTKIQESALVGLAHGTNNPRESRGRDIHMSYEHHKRVWGVGGGMANLGSGYLPGFIAATTIRSLEKRGLLVFKEGAASLTESGKIRARIIEHGEQPLDRVAAIVGKVLNVD